MLFFRSGWLLACCAIGLQIAVYLQTFLPNQYQIAPICETITRALLQDQAPNLLSHAVPKLHSSAQTAAMQDSHSHAALLNHDHPTLHNHQQHADHHQCQYCTVHANLVLPPEFGVQVVFERLLLRLLFFKRSTTHVYFLLQRLFLLPQGRAPPALT